MKMLSLKISIYKWLKKLCTFSRKNICEKICEDVFKNEVEI